jgi:hypothetical protein
MPTNPRTLEAGRWPLRFHIVCALFLPLFLGGVACIHCAAPTLPGAFLAGLLLGASVALFAARCAAGRGPR